MSLFKGLILVIFALLLLGFWQTYFQKGKPETDDRQFDDFIITHDDQNILFDYHEHYKHAIYLSKMDGTDVRKIKEGDQRLVNWDLSPDDKKLLFIQGSSRGKLSLIDLQNLSETSIIEAGDMVQDAIFSPDGNKIYYASIAEFRKEPLSSDVIISVDLFSIDANGTNKRKLGQLPGAVNLDAADDQNLYLHRSITPDKFTVMKLSLLSPGNVDILHESLIDQAYLIYPVVFRPDFKSIIYVKPGRNSKTMIYEQKLNQDSNATRFVNQEFDWIGHIKFMHLENKIIFQGDSSDHFMEIKGDGTGIKESPLSKLRSSL